MARRSLNNLRKCQFQNVCVSHWRRGVIRPACERRTKLRTTKLRRRSSKEAPILPDQTKQSSPPISSSYASMSESYSASPVSSKWANESQKRSPFSSLKERGSVRRRHHADKVPFLLGADSGVNKGNVGRPPTFCLELELGVSATPVEQRSCAHDTRGVHRAKLRVLNIPFWAQGSQLGLVAILGPLVGALLR